MSSTATNTPVGLTPGGVVLVTSRSFSSGSRDVAGGLSAAGLTVVRGPADHDPEELRESLSNAVAWIAGTGPVTAAHLDMAPQLRIVARYGVGVDSVDLAAAGERGVIVTNTPGANSRAVAEYALGLLIAGLRGVVPGDRRVRTGKWTASRGREIGRLVVGVVGFGRIGRLVAGLLAGFGAMVLAFDPLLDDATVRAGGAEPASLAELAERCDAVTLHAPGGRRVIDAVWLAHARPGLVLVNTARADLVDEDVVAAALRDGRLACYAADALANESAAAGGPLLAEDLRDLVIVSPHQAAQTVEAIDNMGAAATADVLAVLSGDPPINPVPAEAAR
jgi:D-3-phosphoglycerate dehydrogenase / 2-oxoglutarate reductase